MGTIKHNGILMSLLLLVAGTIKIWCFKMLLQTKKIITTPLEFVVYRFERDATPWMGIWISATSDRIKRRTF